jgi:hypothetical protein
MASLETPVPAMEAEPLIPLQYASPRPRMPDKFTNVCVCKSEALVFATMAQDADPIGVMEVGELFCLGEVVKERGVKRVAAARFDATPVFVPSDVKVFRIRSAKLQGKTVMYEGPGNTFPKMDTLRSGTEIILVDQIKSRGTLFTEIRDQGGRTGYISGDVKVHAVAVKPNSAGKDMLVGGILCIIGVGITVGTYNAAASSPGGGTYFIAWGPAIFGAIQFFKGLGRLGSGQGEPPPSLLQSRIRQIVEEKMAQRESGVAAVSDDQPVISPDFIRWYHVVFALILPYVAVPWGIINLIRGKKRSGLLLLGISVVWLIVFVIIQINSR